MLFIIILYWQQMLFCKITAQYNLSYFVFKMVHHFTFIYITISTVNILPNYDIYVFFGYVEFDTCKTKSSPSVSQVLYGVFVMYTESIGITKGITIKSGMWSFITGGYHLLVIFGVQYCPLMKFCVPDV